MLGEASARISWDDADSAHFPRCGLLQHWPNPSLTRKKPRLTLHESSPDGLQTKCGRSKGDTYRTLREWPSGERILCAKCFSL